MTNPRKNHFTVPHADQLARYFLGPRWSAQLLGNSRVLAGPDGVFFRSESWMRTFRLAGVELPARPSYSVSGAAVMLGSDVYATAVSGSAAKRIANALNRYEPGPRGV